jgi:Ni,Fe-hydrogenase III large subunit
MTDTSFVKTLYNGECISLADVPRHKLEDFLQTIINAADRGWQIASFFGKQEKEEVELYAVLSARTDGIFGIMASRCSDGFPSITPYCPQANLFEREIAEQFGVVPEGHPWFKPLRFHPSLRPGHDAWGRSGRSQILPGVTDFYRVEGEEVHEVAVGPVHAGVIEPGHFRFQCHGEEVFHLEIALGYQHRDIERRLVGGPIPRAMYEMETIAGDTTVGHAWAYAMILESLAGANIPAKAEVLRGIGLELERLANHTGDMGAIAGDTGYLPTSSYCGRIRGDFLNMSALLCGSRFSRGLIRPGGTGFDCSNGKADELLSRLAAARADLTNAVDLIWATPSVLARLEGTGALSLQTARELGLIGPAARACGIPRDSRQDFPYGIYQMSQIPVVTATSGDVYGRTLVRWLEAEKSLDFLEEQLRQMPGGRHSAKVGALSPESIAVAVSEGWRGEVCHVAITDKSGRFARYKVVDPSFHNWAGLAMALRGQQISDFPLCNKSFNLSYCGFDL